MDEILELSNQNTALFNILAIRSLYTHVAIENLSVELE